MSWWHKGVSFALSLWGIAGALTVETLRGSTRERWYNREKTSTHLLFKGDSVLLRRFSV